MSELVSDSLTIILGVKLKSEQLISSLFSTEDIVRIISQFWLTIPHNSLASMLSSVEFHYSAMDMQLAKIKIILRTAVQQKICYGSVDPRMIFERIPLARFLL